MRTRTSPVFEVTAPFGPLGAPPLMQKERDVEEQRADLRQFMGPAAGTSPTEIVVERGDACSEILQQAIDRKADLIVMGTHGRTGLRHVLLGSVAEKIIRNASCPILVVPPHAADVGGDASAVFKRIVYATDFSKPSTAALTCALALAQEADARLTLLHAIEFPQALARHHRCRREQRSTNCMPSPKPSTCGACACWCRLRRGCIARWRPGSVRVNRLARFCTSPTEEQADLIVMGVQGRGTVDLMVLRIERARGHSRGSLPGPGRARPARYVAATPVSIRQQRSSIALDRSSSGHTTERRLSTCVIPRACMAARSAESRSCQERTVPVSVTEFPDTRTLMPRASRSAS